MGRFPSLFGFLRLVFLFVLLVSAVTASADGFIHDPKFRVPGMGCRYKKYPAIPDILGVIPSGALKFAGQIVMGGNCTQYGKSGTLFFLDPKTGAPKANYKFKTRGFPYPIVNTFTPLSDGGMIVAGSFTEVRGVPALSIARLLSDGSVDANFKTPIYQLPNGSDVPLITRTEELPWGSVFVVGSINYRIGETEYSSRGLFNERTGENDLWLQNTEATLKQEFGAESLELKDVYVLRDKRFLALFNFSIASVDYMIIIRYQSDGSRDATWAFSPIRTVGEKILEGEKGGIPIYFSPSFTYSFRGKNLEQSSGHVVMTYEASSAPKTMSYTLARLAPDGTLDPTYTPDQKYELQDVTVLKDDSVVFFVFVGFRSSYVKQMTAVGANLKRTKFKGLAKNSKVVGIFPAENNRDLYIETNTLTTYQTVGAEKALSK